MHHDPSSPLILTLGFHEADQARLDAVRSAHFPPERNMVPAHVTLFHHLPGDGMALVEAQVATLCAGVGPMVAGVVGLRSLGRGVAYVLEAPGVAPLRAALARAWHERLTGQDRQGWRPHITIQNKVTPAEASRLLALLQAGFSPFELRVEGLVVWRYLGGPWGLVSRHAFTGPAPRP